MKLFQEITSLKQTTSNTNSAPRLVEPFLDLDNIFTISKQDIDETHIFKVKINKSPVKPKDSNAP